MHNYIPITIITILRLAIFDTGGHEESNNKMKKLMVSFGNLNKKQYNKQMA
jgi:hypothetical protein